MKDEWEKKLKKAIEYQVSAVSFSEEDSRRILEKVHDNVGERRKMMNGSKKRIVIAAAAMVAAAGSITAIGAGRIAFLSSSTYRDQAIRDFDQLKAEGEKALDTKVKGKPGRRPDLFRRVCKPGKCYG